MEELIREINEFSKERNWDQFHTPINLAKSICIEASELLECFQWDDRNFNIEEVSDELADVMIYCLRMAHVLKLDVKRIIKAKMEKNALKYPVEKAYNRSDKYTKL